MLDTPGRNLKVFRLVATPRAATDIAAMQTKVGAATTTELFERALGVYKALIEAQETGGVVKIVYRRSWRTLWLWKKAYYLDRLDKP